MKLSELERMANVCEDAMLAIIPPIVVAVFVILTLAYFIA